MRANDTNLPANHVLLVEDDPAQAAKLQRMLETDGWEVEVAHNGREALDVIEKHRPDIVVSDVMMPEMGGHTLCAELKKKPDLENIPFILLATLDDPIDIIRGLQCGANSFVVKPYDENQLLSRLRYILANAELHRTPQSEIGVEVHFAGRKHFLTSERIQILDLLLSSSQTTVDKIQALEQQTAELARALCTIQKLQEGYRALLDSNGEGMLVMDDKGAMRYANSAARNLLGSECTSTQDLPLCVPIDIHGVLEMEVARDNAPQAMVEVRATNVEWEGQAARLLTLHDITARKLAIEELERTRQEQLRVKDEFLAHVSHELRSPLSAVDEFVTILLDGLAGPISDQQREYLEIAHRNAGHLRDMIEDLLLATRARSGKVIVEPCEFSLASVLCDVAEGLRQTVTEKGLALKCEAAPGLPAVFADPQRVRQIVLNLVGNAIKFTPAGGTITVAAACRPENEGFLQISVHDTGCGICADDCERIFDQLYQAESTRRQNRKGLGLGLFISRDLVTRQGGRIWVDSTPEQGTTFHFTLPLLAPDQILRHAIQERLAVAGKEQGELCVYLFTLDTDAISRASSIADNGKGVSLNDVWEALAEKAKEIAFHETAFSGSEFTVVAVVPDRAKIAIQEKLRRRLKDVLFETIPGAVAGFSCGVATRTAETAGAAELLAAAREAQVRERERIAAKSIVLVDDDSSARRVLRVGLEQIGMRRVAEASGGGQACALLEEEVPHLMIIDLEMPGMNGYELIGRLKESRRTADIPVLVVSGYAVKTEILREKSPQKAIPVLAKPVDLDALTQYVSYLL